MPMTNGELIAKADQRLADFSAGGLLNAEQRPKFYEVMFKDKKLLPQITTVEMKAPEFEISKATVDDIVLQPATEGVVLPDAARSKITPSKSTIVSYELMGEVHVSYSVLEDNIEGDTFRNLLVRMIGAKVGANLEELVIKGDTSIVLPDPDVSITAWKRARLLKTFDGMLKKMTTNTGNAGGARLSKQILKAMWQTLPIEFRALPNMKWVTSENGVADYWDSIADRQTAAGDAAYQATGEASYMGRKVTSVPLWPDDLGGTADRTDVALLDPRNAHLGIHREITMESEKNIRAREYIVVFHMRVGFNFRHEPETVLFSNILNSADLA